MEATMEMSSSGFINSLRHKSRAHAAAFTHGRPARSLPLIVVTGCDGGHATVAMLASILHKSGSKTGIITPQYIQICNERIEGSQQADVTGDAFRLQALLAQMKKAGCDYVLLEMPDHMPAHEFTSIPVHMVIMRRCGDSRSVPADNTAQQRTLKKLLARKPRYVVLNRDDPCFKEVFSADSAEFVMTYGIHEKAECRITDVQLHPKGSAINLLADHQTPIELATPLAGKQVIYSAAAAAAAGYLLHKAVPDIEDGIFTVPHQDAQFEYITANRPYKIVVDNSFTPDGVADTLETIKRFTKNRVIAVVAATAEQPTSWRPLIGELVGTACDRVLVTDGDWQANESRDAVRQQILQGAVAAGGEAKTDDIPERALALEKALSIARRGDTIVVCGVPLRPYRLHGSTRTLWNDKLTIEDLLQP